jgi:hypothetical protein
VNVVPDPSASVFQLLNATPPRVRFVVEIEAGLSRVKVVSFGAMPPTEKFHFLNLKSSVKTLLVVVASLGLKYMGLNISHFLLAIYVIFIVMTFFTLTEVFVKRTPSQDQWHQKRPLLYYVGGVLVFTLIAGNAFSFIGPK